MFSQARFKRRNATSKSIKCDIFQFDASQSNIRLIQSNMRLNFDSWFKRRILHVPNWIEIMLNNLCLLEWEFKTRPSRSVIWFGKTMWRLNQISRTYSFESTKISIWFGACKMRRLNQASGIHDIWHVRHDRGQRPQRRAGEMPLTIFASLL